MEISTKASASFEIPHEKDPLVVFWSYKRTRDECKSASCTGRTSSTSRGPQLATRPWMGEWMNVKRRRASSRRNVARSSPSSVSFPSGKTLPEHTCVGIKVSVVTRRGRKTSFCIFSYAVYPTGIVVIIIIIIRKSRQMMPVHCNESLFCRAKNLPFWLDFTPKYSRKITLQNTFICVDNFQLIANRIISLLWHYSPATK